MQRVRVSFVVFASLSALACAREKAPAAPVPAAAPVAAAPVTTPAPVGPRAKVVVRTGLVEVLRQGEAGWASVNVGDSVGLSDSVRTHSDGTVELAVNNARLRLKQRSELRLKAIESNRVRAQVTGRLESAVKDGAGRLEVEAAGSDAVVSTDNGHFSMLSDGRGVVAVATTEGRVGLSAKGKEVSIPAGHVGRLTSAGQPAKPSRALKNVVLSVDWPDQRLTNRRKLALSGSVEVGSRVYVQGRPAVVGADGSFSSDVQLRDGRQEVTVVVEDLMGRKKSARSTFQHDSRAPAIELKETSYH